MLISSNITSKSKSLGLEKKAIIFVLGCASCSGVK